MPVAEQTILKAAIDEAIRLRTCGDYEGALKHHEITRELFEDEPSYRRKWWAGVGRTNRLLGRHEEALDAYRVAMNIPATCEEEKAEIVCMAGNLANTLVDMGRTSEAHAFLDRCERGLIEANKWEWLGIHKETRARAFRVDGDYENAMNTALEAINLLWHRRTEVSEGDNKLTLATTLNAIDGALETFWVCWEAKQRVK